METELHAQISSNFEQNWVHTEPSDRTVHLFFRPVFRSFQYVGPCNFHMCLHWMARLYPYSTSSDQQNKLKIVSLFFDSTSASNAEINGPLSVLHMLTAYTQMLIIYRISENKNVSFSFVYFFRLIITIKFLFACN